MDRLQAMRLYVCVVEANSFSRAAEIMNLPRASVTITVQKLEAILGAQLLQRTTRRSNLTSEGAAYYERCKRILSEVEEAEGMFGRPNIAPRGTCRVQMPSCLGRLIVIPELAEFSGRFPDIDLTIRFGELAVDLVNDAVDCAIAIGPLKDSSMVARRLCIARRVTLASPSYLARHGLPKTVGDLRGHKSIRYSPSSSPKGADLTFLVGDQCSEPSLRSALAVSDAEAYIACGLTGMGIIQIPLFMATPYLKTGDLTELLPDFRPAPVPVSVLYPKSRHLSATIRAFVEWVSDVFSRSSLLERTRDASHSVTTYHVVNDRHLMSDNALSQ